MFFYFPSVKKIYIYWFPMAQFVFPGENTLRWRSVCRDFTRRVFLGSTSAGESEQGEKEYSPYLTEREILCEELSTSIQKFLKGFWSWVRLAELWCTGARWLALFITLSAGHCMQAASRRKCGLVWGESIQLRALTHWGIGWMLPSGGGM